MKRNCLLIIVDCLRADKCWGDTKTAKTPNIDSLCHRGTIFTQAIATTTTTSPSLASIITGLYPQGHGIRSLYGYRLKPSAKTLAQVFTENGYHTYAEITGPLVPELGLDRGFNEYHLRDSRDNMYSAWYDNLLLKFRKKEFQEPYFILFHFFELHMPRQIAREYNNGSFGKNSYDRALSSFDAQLGKLLSCIDDDTIIVLHADHGEKITETMMGERASKLATYYMGAMRKLGRKPDNLYLIGHGFHVYDFLIRVPLIFSGKGIFPEGKVVSAQVRQIDIFPTIVEALELKGASAEVHGRSLLPLVRGEALPDVPAYSEACGQILPDKAKWLAGIRTPKYKYVFAPYGEDSREQLYDLEKDPNEKKNIAQQRREIVRELRQKSEEIQKADKETTLKQRIRRLKTLGRI